MFIRRSLETASPSSTTQTSTPLSVAAINETIEKLGEAATRLEQASEHEGIIAITELGYFGVTEQKCGGGLANVPSIALLREGSPESCKNILPHSELLAFLKAKKIEIFIPLDFVTHPELKQGLAILIPTINRIANTATIHEDLGATGLSIYRDPRLRNRITIESSAVIPEAA